MASKKQLVPSEIQTVQNLPTIDSGFVGFGAKSDGLYMKTDTGVEYKLLTLQDGNLLHSGTTVPSPTLGRIGDYYINNTDWTIYGPKFATSVGPGEGDQESWGAPTDIKGSVGTNGNMWYTGATVPINTQYNNGDFYLRSNGVVYQKVNGIWTQVSNLIGPVGPIGPGGFSDTSLNVGMISQWAGNANSVPEGWLLCDGSTVLKEELYRIYTVEQEIYYGNFGGESLHLYKLSADEAYNPSKQPQVGAIIEYGSRLNPSITTVKYITGIGGYYIIGTVEQLPIHQGLTSGSVVIRDDRVYPELVSVLAGAAEWHAHIPDLRGRFVVGYSQSNQDYNYIGKLGGLDSVVLTAEQLPEHTHPIRYSVDLLGNEYKYPTTNWGENYETEYASIQPPLTSDGGAQSHENRPPYYTTAFIIKASYIADMTGKTAYDVYLQSTNDDPVLTREEWLESLKGTSVTLDEDLVAIAALPESTGFLKKTGNVWSIEEGSVENSMSIDGGVASSVYGGTIGYDFGGANII